MRVVSKGSGGRQTGSDIRLPEPPEVVALSTPVKTVRSFREQGRLF